jgi:hypothetical protein
MSVDHYRQRISQIGSDIARAESDVASALGRAAGERESALRDQSSASRASSAFSAQTYMRSAQRHQERAIQFDKDAAKAQALVSSKRRALLSAERDLASASAREQGRSHLASRVRYDGSILEGRVQNPEQADERVSVARWTEDTTADAALETGRALAIGALGSVPLIGPILSELVGTAWGSNRVDRMVRFAEELGRNVEQIQDRVDREFVKHREFEELAEDVLDRVVQRRNDRKGERFAAVVANSATFDRPDQRERDHFIDALDQLRPHQIELLRRLAAPDETWNRDPSLVTVGQVAQDRLAHALRGLDYKEYDWGELQRRGFVQPLSDNVILLKTAADHRSVVTELGSRFLGFVSAARREVLAGD